MKWNIIENELYRDFGYSPQNFNYRVEHVFHSISNVVKHGRKVLIITYFYGEGKPEVDGILGSIALILVFKNMGLKSTIISTREVISSIASAVKALDLNILKNSGLSLHVIPKDYDKVVRMSFNVLVKNKPDIVFSIGRNSRLKPLNIIVNLIVKTDIPHYAISKLGYETYSMETLQYPIVNLALYALGNALAAKFTGKPLYNSIIEKRLYEKLVPKTLQPYYVYISGSGKMEVDIDFILSKIERINNLVV